MEKVEKVEKVAKEAASKTASTTIINRPARGCTSKLLNDSIVDAVCERIIEGETLTQTCKDVGVNRTCFLRSISRDTEESKKWHDQYMEARRLQVIGWIDELLEISNGPGEGHDGKERIQRDTLKFRTRQWMMSRLASTIFGEKIQQELTGAKGGPVLVRSQVIDAPQPEDYEQFRARKEKERC